MMAILGVLWGLLTAAGGTLALGLIVTLAVGINALTLLFLGSAVVTLERFARASRRRVSLLGFTLVWTFVVAAGVVSWGPESLENAVRNAGWRGMSVVLAGAALAVALAIVGVRFALRHFSADRLAGASALVLGLGYALVLGASGKLVYAAAPAVIAGGAVLLLALRRRRGAERARAGETERFLRVLAMALGSGIALAAALPGPAAPLAALGGWLLGVYLAAVLLGLVPLAAAGLLDTRDTAEWFIAVRYLVAKRRQTFISVITGICVIGIAAGVWLIITVLSVMNGFERTWRDEIIGNRAHLTVQHGFGPFADYTAVLARIETVPEVVAASPYVDAEGMVRGNAGEIMAVRVRGIDPQRVGKVTDLREDLIAGSVDALTPGAAGEPATGEAKVGASPPAAGAAADPGIVIGSQLAAAVGASVGDPILLISPFGGPQTPLGPSPRLARFKVVGIFESSFFQYDEMFTYVSLAAAQDFKRVEDVVDGIEVRTTDYYRSQSVGQAIVEALGFPYFTRDWKEFFPAFFQALKSERIMMFVLLTMIMVVAAFSIVSTLVMMIMEKSSDIAILKAMGAKDESIERIFAIEGTLIGLVGTGLGVIAGISVTAQIAWIQHQIEAVTGIDTLPASVYQFSTLPAELDAGQVAIAVAIAMILALGATLLPSRQGARLDPVESLRYE
jgi:lipoprotein-releasing system permease protein